MMGATFYYEDEREREKKVSLILKMSGGSKSRFTSIPYPLPTVELTRRDWQIVAALQRQSGRRRPSQIAANLGISVRTLKRRTKRMIEGMAIATILSSEVRAFRGGVIGNLLVEYAPGATRREIDGSLLKELDSCMIYAGLWTDFSLFSLVLPSIPAATNILARIRNIRGVRTARLELIDERIEVYSSFTDQVEKKLRSLVPR